MAELEQLSRSYSCEVRMFERARIVLACLRGKRNGEIARVRRRRFAIGLLNRHSLPGARRAPWRKSFERS